MKQDMDANVSYLRYKFYSRSIFYMKIFVGYLSVVCILVMAAEIYVSRANTLDSAAESKNAVAGGVLAKLQDSVPPKPKELVPFPGNFYVHYPENTEPPYDIFTKSIQKQRIKTAPANPIVNPDFSDVFSAISRPILANGRETTATIPIDEENKEEIAVPPVDDGKDDLIKNPPINCADIIFFRTDITDGAVIYDTNYSFTIDQLTSFRAENVSVLLNGEASGTLLGDTWSGALLENAANDIEVNVTYEIPGQRSWTATKKYTVTTEIQPLRLMTDLSDGITIEDTLTFYAYGYKNGKECRAEVYLENVLLEPEADGRTYTVHLLEGDNVFRVRSVFNGEVTQEEEITITYWIEDLFDVTLKRPLGMMVKDPAYYFSAYVYRIVDEEPIETRLYFGGKEMIRDENGWYHVTLKPGMNYIELRYTDDKGNACSTTRDLALLR